MTYRSDIFNVGQYYHIYNRGAGKGLIFYNPGNYEYFLYLLKHYSTKYKVGIIAYCLMPNHYHFLLRQGTEEPLSKFMGVLFNAYGQALNQQQERTGTLFADRFKYKWVEKWEYLMMLSRYIHLNPVKAGLINKPEDWLYSNYQEWVGLRNGTLVDMTFVKTHFPEATEYIEFVNNVEMDKSQLKLNHYLFD